MLLGDINESEMKRREFYGLIISLPYAIVLMIFVTYCVIKGLHDVPWHEKFLLVCLLTLTFMYTLVTVVLNRVMKKLSGDFKKEKRSINC